MKQGIVHVVDDDPVVREALVWMLSTLGYGVHAHETTDEVPRDGEPGCVILDECLGGTSGLDAVDQTSGRLANRPVILLSGVEMGDLRPRAAAHGVRMVLSKPVEVTALMQAVNLALKVE